MTTDETGLATDRRLTSEQVESLGRRIYEAESQRRPVAPLTDEYPEMAVEDAYAVQLVYARLRKAAGARLIGHKIGATSEAIQELFDIDTPDYGHLFDDMRCDETEALPISELIQPLVEPEIAFILDADLKGPGVSAEDVLNATRQVVACLEIIDSRIDDWRIRLADTISDNGSSARFVLGSNEMPPSFDLAAEQVVLKRNGEVVGTGAGAAVLGHPATSVAWLANAVGPLGSRMAAGSIALSGSLTSAVEARPGDRFVAEFSTLGVVTLEIERERMGQ